MFKGILIGFIAVFTICLILFIRRAIKRHKEKNSRFIDKTKDGLIDNFYVKKK